MTIAQNKYPAVFRTYVRIPDYVELDNAEELADAIIREVELKEAWLTRVLGNSADPDASVGKWDRRLAQCGGIDEMSKWGAGNILQSKRSAGRLSGIH